MTKELYYARKNNKLCTNCGEPLPVGWKHVQCIKCRKIKEKNPRPISTEHITTRTNKALDKMAKEAHKRGISYGRLQSEETIERIRKAKRVNTSLKQWGGGVWI